jgi:hypothetical protein
MRSGTPDLQGAYAKQNESLQDMYTRIANAINGNIKTNRDLSAPFKPTIISTDGDGGTGTYTQQVGWSYRQGLLTDIWFDVTWTAHSIATGNLAMKLPYQVIKSAGLPFIGICQLSSITFAGNYVTITAIPDTRRLEFWDTTTAAATSAVAMGTAGRAVGHLRYIGREIERP